MELQMRKALKNISAIGASLTGFVFVSLIGFIPLSGSSSPRS